METNPAPAIHEEPKSTGDYEEEALMLYSAKTTTNREEPVLDLPETLDLGEQRSPDLSMETLPELVDSMPTSPEIDTDLQVLDEQEFNFDFGPQELSPDFPSAMRAARDKQATSRGKRQRRATETDS